MDGWEDLRLLQTGLPGAEDLGGGHLDLAPRGLVLDQATRSVACNRFQPSWVGFPVSSQTC